MVDLRKRVQYGAVMICQCCGRYTVELIYLDIGRGRRPRLRVRYDRHYVGDYSSPVEVAEVLRQRGVLDQLIDADQKAG